MDFVAARVSHEHVQMNDALPEQVFPLLCPVREAEWVPGWQCRMIYSRSGFAEQGCVFATPNDDGSETIWMVIEYDPAALRIGYVWAHPGRLVAELRISLRAVPPDRAATLIRYTYTGLSAGGNAVVARYDAEWFKQKMRGWETAINHYLRTGSIISAAAWE